MQKKTTDNAKEFNDLIHYIIENPEDGMDIFYSKYSKFITSVVRAYCYSEDQVNSSVNSVTIKIWRKAKSLPEIKNPYAFLYKVASNCAKDERNVRWHLELKEQICGGENCFAEIEETDSFNSIIKRLDIDEQQIMSFRFKCGISFKDIAKMMGKPLPTISTKYYRALEKLKKQAKNINFE